MSCSVLVLGANSFLKQRFIQRQVQEWDVLAIEVDWTDTDQKQSFFASVKTPSFFQPLRVFHLRNLSGKKDKKLQDLLTQIPPDVNLILEALDRKTAPAWIRSLTVDKIQTFDPLKKWDLGSWVKKEAASKSMRLSDAYAEAIVQNVGEDMYALSNELDKLHIYLNGKSSPSVEDIQAVLYQHETFSPFDIIKFWGDKSRDMALVYFHKHFDQTPESQHVGSILVLLSGLQGHVERMIRVKGFKLAGLSSAKIAEKIKANPYVFKNNIEPQIKVRTMEELEEAHLKLCGLEVILKTGSTLVQSRGLLEQFLIQH